MRCGSPVFSFEFFFSLPFCVSVKGFPPGQVGGAGLSLGIIRAESRPLCFVVFSVVVEPHVVLAE